MSGADTMRGARGTGRWSQQLRFGLLVATVGDEQSTAAPPTTGAAAAGAGEGVGAAGTTVTVVDADLRTVPTTVAVTIAVPGRTPVAMPFWSTLATFTLLEENVKVADATGLLAPS